MQELAELSDCEKFLYHASINPAKGERLTVQQWENAVDLLEKNLGLEGHQRATVKHVKDGRAHYHIVWDRVDLDTLTAVRMSHNYRAHELTARELEREFGLERVQGAHVERDGPRPERQPKQWEVDRGRRSGIDPRKVKEEVSELWAWAENGADFARALEARGYILAQGDRRDFVIIDSNGDPHSIARRAGAKAAEVREKLADIDKEALPTVEQAKELQQERQEEKAAASLEKSYELGADMVSQQQAATRHHEQRQKALEEAEAAKQREAEEAKRREAETLKALQAKAQKDREEAEKRQREAAQKEREEAAKKQREQEARQREEQRTREQGGGFAGRKDHSQQKQEERTARTEQTEAQRREHQKNIMKELFERRFGKGHNENTLDNWERERER